MINRMTTLSMFQGVVQTCNGGKGYFGFDGGSIHGDLGRSYVQALLDNSLVQFSERLDRGGSLFYQVDRTCNGNSPQ